MNLEQAKARAEVFKALAHPVRLLVALALREEELSLGQLHKRVHVTVSTLSRHVTQMKKAGVVAERRAGARVIHSLVLPALLDAVEPAQRVVAQRVRRQQQAV
jgi:DNA-binding transcriptional ArsR family regulator